MAVPLDDSPSLQRWLPLARLEEMLARTEAEVGQAVAGLPGDQVLARVEYGELVF
jgi:hypothetical protein